MNWTYLGLAVAFAIAGVAVAMAALAHIRITNAQSETRALRRSIETREAAANGRFGKEYVKVLDLERVIRGMGYRQGQRGWVRSKSEAGMDKKSAEYQEGNEAGFAEGFEDGYAKGRAEAIEEAAKACDPVSPEAGALVRAIE